VTPIDFHCHGVGDADLSKPNEVDLQHIDSLLKVEDIAVVLVFSLSVGELENFEGLMQLYEVARERGELRNIVGIALEGPILSLVGGTPEKGCWSPEIGKWHRIAALGPKGLVYCVLSPDYELGDDPDHPESTLWIARTLLKQGVMPALGHFRKDNPEASAKLINEMCETLASEGLGPIITDHMFNDMPLNFKHTWRTREEREERATQIAEILAQNWSETTIDDVIGPVPAAIIRQAWKGNLKVCLNFDGDHVDINVCRKFVDLISADNLLLMTDRIPGKRLGGRKLVSHADNTLLYQDQGIVAGGSQSVVAQLGNMMRSGMASNNIYKIAFANPYDLLRTLSTSRSKREEVEVTA